MDHYLIRIELMGGLKFYIFQRTRAAFEGRPGEDLYAPAPPTGWETFDSGRNLSIPSLLCRTSHLFLKKKPFAFDWS